MKPLPDPWHLVPNRKNNVNNLSPPSNAKHTGALGKCWNTKTKILHQEVTAEKCEKTRGNPSMWLHPRNRGEDCVKLSSPCPHLSQHGQPQAGAKAKVTLVSLGLSFNNLMFLPLRQVMKTSIPGTQDCSMILKKTNPGLARRNFIFLAVVS